MERKIQGFCLAVFMLTVCFLPPATAAGPPSCLAYAYLESDDHSFLVSNNSTGYGNELNVVHNCGRVQVFLDEEFLAEGESGLSVSIEPGNYSIELRGENESWSYANFEVRPDRLDWDFNWSIAYGPIDGKLIQESEARQMQNWAAGATGLIIWVLCVYVYWNLINSYTQRNFIEEVQG